MVHLGTNSYMGVAKAMTRRACCIKIYIYIYMYIYTYILYTIYMFHTYILCTYLCDCFLNRFIDFQWFKFIKYSITFAPGKKRSSVKYEKTTLRQKCSYSEFLWSVFSHIWTEYVIRMRENMDQKNSEYGHFSHSAGYYCC